MIKLTTPDYAFCATTPLKTPIHHLQTPMITYFSSPYSVLLLPPYYYYYHCRIRGTRRGWGNRTQATKRTPRRHKKGDVMDAVRRLVSSCAVRDISLLQPRSPKPLTALLARFLPNDLMGFICTSLLGSWRTRLACASRCLCTFLHGPASLRRISAISVCAERTLPDF